MMMDRELRRTLLLWEEGLLCRRCHDELNGPLEMEFGICLGCVREENALHPLPDGPEPEGGDDDLPF